MTVTFLMEMLHQPVWMMTSLTQMGFGISKLQRVLESFVIRLDRTLPMDRFRVQTETTKTVFASKINHSQFFCLNRFKLFKKDVN